MGRFKMKQKFIDRKFTPESQELLEHIERILNDYELQGYDLSLRQLYYQLVSEDLLPERWADPITKSTNNERSYKNIGSLVSDARLAGLLDWDMIKDRGREMTELSHWTHPGDMVFACSQQFHLDLWKNQSCYVEVMVEKQALEGVLEPVCRELDVPFTANKGYSSSSAMYEAGQRISDKMADGKDVHIYYLGDHDPSGIDMGRDVLERLRMFADQNTFDETIFVHRIALNLDQVRELNPPENPAKITDSRSKSYISKFGRSSWELDAIEPARLASLVRAAVRSQIDFDIWKRDVALRDDMRSELAAVAAKLRKKKF